MDTHQILTKRVEQLEWEVESMKSKLSIIECSLMDKHYWEDDGEEKRSGKDFEKITIRWRRCRDCGKRVSHRSTD